MEFQKELSLLLQYLDIELSSEEKNELEQAVSFKELKKENPKHLKKGESGYWMEQLTEYQVKKTNLITGPLLKYLGYPEREEKMQFSRELPSCDFEKLKNEIIASQEQLRHF
ncbi:hypothetical protein GCM10010465_14490 [Actinomadura fibrosa]